MKTLAANDPLALAALLDSYAQLTIGAEEISAISYAITASMNNVGSPA